MAFHHPHHHQQNNHTTTTTSYCYCQPPPPPPPCYHPHPHPHPHPQPIPFPTTTTTTTDPYVVASIVTQLLQQSPQNLTKTKTQNQRHQIDPFSSLLERIDALEASLQRYSSGTCSLRDAAARIIQAHYRAHLVHRSKTLGQLQELASIKSALTSLKSSLSRNAFIDFDFLSNQAMDLLLHLDSIQSGDKMIKDSKRSVTKDIVEFLDLVDGVCVKRHQVLTKKVKNLRLVRNDNRGVGDTRGLSHHNVGSKCRNVGGEEKKLIANLRERVEKIGRMTKVLEEQEDEVYGDAEIKGFKHVDNDYEDEDDIADQITGRYRVNNRMSTKKNAQTSNAKKRVGFVEDGNVIKFFDVDGASRSASRLVEVIEDSNKGSHDEEEATSDGDGSSHSSENMRESRSDEVAEESGNLDEDFTFSNPELAKLDTRGDFMSRKSGVKIVG